MHIPKAVLAAAVLAVAASGCILSNRGVVTVRHGAVEVENQALATYFQIGRELMTFTSEGMMHIQVDVRNAYDEDLECQYRFQWIGKNGMLLTHANSPWLTKRMNAGENGVFEGVSPVAGAEDFRLVIRWVPRDDHRRHHDDEGFFGGLFGGMP